jgi:RimJ/RimL family protein N-acetyltransferase
MLDFNFHITTPRLTISYINPDNDSHCDFVYQLNNSPEMLLVNRSLPNVLSTRDATREWLQKGAAALEKIGYGRYLISRRPVTSNELQSNDKQSQPFSQSIDTHDLVGVVSLQKERYPSAPPIPDIGFAILAKYYGKGYATEAAEGLMKYYREERGQTKFAGYCDPGNESSKKVLKRLGFDEAGVREVKGLIGEEVGLECAVFTLGVESEWVW